MNQRRSGKKCAMVDIILGMLILFAMFSGLVTTGYTTGDKPEYFLFNRTTCDQSWNGAEIAAANGAESVADNIGLTLQLFMVNYHYDPDPGDFDDVELRVLAFAVDRDKDMHGFSDYIIKDLKITMKKMSIEDDNGFSWDDLCTWTGNYFINDDQAEIFATLDSWRNYNLTFVDTLYEAQWVNQLIIYPGTQAAISLIISSLGLGIPGTVASIIVNYGLNLLLKSKINEANDPQSTPAEYQPAYCKGVNNQLHDFCGFSDFGLGGEVTWRLWDECRKNHRLEIIAELTYGQYYYDGGWYNEHTLKTSISVSSVLGDGYDDKYDYRTEGSTQYPGNQINVGYDAPNSYTPYAPSIYPGKLYQYIVDPYGNVDPYVNQYYIEYSYSGYLNQSYDNHDWFKAYIQSKYYYQENRAYVRLDVPEGTDFNLEIYDPITGEHYFSVREGSITDELSIPIPSSRNLYIHAYVYEGSGEYILTVYEVHKHYLGGAPSGGGEQCPYVATWNGSQYVADNNILPESENFNRTQLEVDDIYKLEQKLVPKDNVYSVKIQEFENEHSYLDQFQLVAVDHDANVNIALSPEGDILTYKNPIAPTYALRNGKNVTLALSSPNDGKWLEGVAGDILILRFNEVKGSKAKLIVRTDPPVFKSLVVEIEIAQSENWISVGVLHPRVKWSTQAIDLTQYVDIKNMRNEITVKMIFTDFHRIDFVGLDTSDDEKTISQTLDLSKATHSNGMKVTKPLSLDDDRFVELKPGEEITLEFPVPKMKGEVRDFILLSKGYYILKYQPFGKVKVTIDDYDDKLSITIPDGEIGKHWYITISDVTWAINYGFPAECLSITDICAYARYVIVTLMVKWTDGSRRNFTYVMGVRSSYV